MQNDVVINLNTGDLIFYYSGENEVWYDCEINGNHYCAYDYVGMIVKDPNFHDFKCKGLFVLEIEKQQFGFKHNAALRTFDEAISKCNRADVRYWNNLSDKCKNKVNNVYENVMRIPYDYRCGFIGKCCNSMGLTCCRRDIDELYFFSSELIGMALYMMGIIHHSINYQNLSVRDIALLEHDKLSKPCRIK